MSSRIPVIVNSAAGAAAAIIGEFALPEHFSSAGMDAEIEMVSPAGKLVEAIRRAISKNPKIIVVGGGDGTLNSAAQMLVGSGITLGILPVGTLNHFAKDLRIPLDIGVAIRTIAEGRTAKVDVGVVNDRHFLNNSSLGLYPRMVQKREEQRLRMRRGKWPAFLFAALSVLRRYPFLDVRLNVDGGEVVRRTPFVFVGNNRYEMEGFKIGSRPRLDRGELSLYMAQRLGRVGLFVLAARALLRRLNQARDFDSMTAKEIIVDTRRKRLHVATDGEISVMVAPLRYRILPGALSVIVPGPGDLA